VQVPIEISFKEVKKTAYLEDLINQKIAKLERLCRYMISCRVTLEKPQEHQASGNPYQVSIDMHIPPAHHLVVKHKASAGDMHDPLTVVITKVFHIAERRLKELTERQHGEIKSHPQQQVMGIVHQLFPEQGYGFVKTVDTQQDVYFHRHSVLHDDFNKLTPGTGVRFVTEQGRKGPQATSVEVVYPVRV